MQNLHNKANNKLEFKVRQQIKVNKIYFFLPFFVNLLILIVLFYDNNYHYNSKKPYFMDIVLLNSIDF